MPACDAPDRWDRPPPLLPKSPWPTCRRGVSERELWATLIRVPWPHRTECPHCRERDLQCLELIDVDYRGKLGRWCCQACGEVGDPGERGTFSIYGLATASTPAELRPACLTLGATRQQQPGVPSRDDAVLQQIRRVVENHNVHALDA
jgi:hypothetical protein